VEVENVITEYALHQNYPNPFNPATKISYDIPVESNVKIEIYNSMGEKVYELYSGVKESGNHELEFNSRNLASGIYFYSMTATAVEGGRMFSDVKKMIYMK